jgi:hypothetical protein
MFSSNYSKSRFNLLYLHESEVKTDEREVSWHFHDQENNREQKQSGLMHIGSKCLYLESMQENQPIFKFQMKNFTTAVDGQGNSEMTSA